MHPPPRRARALRLTRLSAVVVFYLLLTITITGVYKILPGQLDAVQHRMVYYFFGQEADKPRVYVQRFVAGLVGNSSAREL